MTSLGRRTADPHPARKGLLTVHSRQTRSYIERPVRGTNRTILKSHWMSQMPHNLPFTSGNQCSRFRPTFTHTYYPAGTFCHGAVTWDWQGKSADATSIRLAAGSTLQHQVINNPNSGYSFTPGLWPVLSYGYHDVGKIITYENTAIRVEVTPGS